MWDWRLVSGFLAGLASTIGSRISLRIVFSGTVAVAKALFGIFPLETIGLWIWDQPRIFVQDFRDWDQYLDTGLDWIGLALSFGVGVWSQDQDQDRFNGDGQSCET